MKKQKKLLLAWDGILLIAGIAAALFHQTLIGLLPPCVIYSATGLLCPSCGITRMITALLHFDLPAAFQWNPVLFCALFYALFLLIYYHFIVFGIFSGKRMHKLANLKVLGLFLGALLLFTILRNLV